jgi:hypothetical protein
MKKILLTASVVIAGLFQSNAQCVIVPSCVITPSVGYCSSPSPSTSLPNGVISTPYSTTIQISLASSVYTMGLNVPIQSGTITAVTGVPAGLSVTYNPANGVIAGGSNGCILISGTPTTSGSNTITATFSVQTSAGVVGGSASWYLTIDLTAGVNQLTQSANVMLMSPNPAKSELNVTTDFHIAKLTVIDALGKVVLAQDVNYANQTTLDIRGLEKGLYFLQATEGSKMITKKFIKD